MQYVLVHDDDTIVIHDRVQSVRDGEHGAVRELRADRALDVLVRAGGKHRYNELVNDMHQ